MDLRSHCPVRGFLRSLLLLTNSVTVANNFWGAADAGVNPLLQRMQNAKQTCDELKAFYTGMYEE
jgi:hypothetical protein